MSKLVDDEMLFILPFFNLNSNPQPPHNPAIAPEDEEFPNRVAGFEGSDEPVIWNTNIRQPNTISTRKMTNQKTF